MKLASRKNGTRDGQLVVVSRDLTRCIAVAQLAPTLQSALDRWDELRPQLQMISDRLNKGGYAEDAEDFHPIDCRSPLPRAYQWADGSAYVNHVELVRKARGADMPPSFWTDPLMYQGGSDSFVDPMGPIEAASEDYGIDLEAEVAVVTGDVAMGAAVEAASAAIRLIMLVNDISLRNLIPPELAKGFGFFQSKPSSAFSPVAVTPDELGANWDGCCVNLPLLSSINEQPLGAPQAGIDMTFDFPTLVAHAAKTRPLAAGTIIGSGTVSNLGPDGGPGTAINDGGVGYSCLAELRCVETLLHGKPRTAFLRFGDQVRIEMRDQHGESIFGAIEQVVARYKK